MQLMLKGQYPNGTWILVDPNLFRGQVSKTPNVTKGEECVCVFVMPYINIIYFKKNNAIDCRKGIDINKVPEGEEVLQLDQ